MPTRQTFDELISQLLYKHVRFTYVATTVLPLQMQIYEMIVSYI